MVAIGRVPSRTRSASTTTPSTEGSSRNTAGSPVVDRQPRRDRRRRSRRARGAPRRRWSRHLRRGRRVSVTADGRHNPPSPVRAAAAVRRPSMQPGESLVRVGVAALSGRAAGRWRAPWTPRTAPAPARGRVRGRPHPARTRRSLLRRAASGKRDGGHPDLVAQHVPQRGVEAGVPCAATVVVGDGAHALFGCQSLTGRAHGVCQFLTFVSGQRRHWVPPAICWASSDFGDLAKPSQRELVDEEQAARATSASSARVRRGTCTARRG